MSERGNIVPSSQLSLRVPFTMCPRAVSGTILGSGSRMQAMKRCMHKKNLAARHHTCVKLLLKLLKLLSGIMLWSDRSDQCRMTPSSIERSSF